MYFQFMISHDRFHVPYIVHQQNVITENYYVELLTRRDYRRLEPLDEQSCIKTNHVLNIAYLIVHQSGSDYLQVALG